MLTKEQKAKLRATYAADVWNGNDHMTDYCTNKVSVLAELPNGEFIPVDKRSIEKDFCFGESGYDFDEAVESAHIARTSETYFLRENMKGFLDDLKSIEEQYKMFDPARPSLPHYILTIAEKPYIGQPETSPLKDIHYWRDGDVLDAMGGSAYVQELPGKHFNKWDNFYRIPTLEELNTIKAAYEQATQEHQKKVERYLKRYGLSKVNSWTYWRDA